MTVRDRVAGALLAHAAGDALGATTEFSTPEQIIARYGEVRDITGGGAFHWRPGQGTDDTDLTLIGCDSLAAHEQLDVDDLAARLLHWYRSNPVDIGSTTSRALRRLQTGTPPNRSGLPSPAAGNGSLMRTLAPGLALVDPVDRFAYAAAFSAITHADPDCVIACTAYSDIVAGLIDGADPAAAIDYAAVRYQTHATRTALTVTGLDDVDHDPGGWVIHSLRIAIGALHDAEHHGVEDTIIRIVNRGGDADTNAAIAGGLLGARHGTAAIPTRWTERLEQHARINKLADRLSELRSQNETR